MPTKQHAHNFNDLTGNQYGNLTVIKYLGHKNGQSRWLCRCICGNEVERLGVSLKNGTSSCGCEKKKELIGRRFGKLTVISYDEEGSKGATKWVCRCDCGTIKSIKRQSLVDGVTVSCGCKKRNDLDGKRFGRLLVIERAGQNKWKCKCDCGNEVTVLGSNLTRGNSTSCGCYANELNSIRSTTHGDSKKDSKYHRLYKIWTGMKTRCYNSHTKQYKYYGKNGIKLCDDWLAYSNFKQWSIENGYNDSLTIDRIDINGNYCPENCRWATKKEQANNKSTSVFLTVCGKTKTVNEWAKEIGVNQSTISWRHRNGWTDIECLYGKNCAKMNEKLDE